MGIDPGIGVVGRSNLRCSALRSGRSKKLSVTCERDHRLLAPAPALLDATEFILALANMTIAVSIALS